MFDFRPILLLFCCCCFALADAKAQKLPDLKKAGEKAFDLNHWSEALNLLGQYQQLKPGDPGVLTRLGVVHYHLGQGARARQYLEFVAGQDPNSKNVELFYYLALTLHGLQDFDRAIPQYKSFLRVADDKDPRRAMAIDNIRRCAIAPSLVPYDPIALVENLGDRVNTPGDEFAPLPAVGRGDLLYFSAARQGATGGRRNTEGFEDTVKGVWCADMYVSTQSSAGWDYPAPLNGLLNTPRHEAALDFNRSGKILYYSRGFTLFAGDFLLDTINYPDEYALVPTPFVSTMKPQAGDAAPFFFADSIILFASRRSGGFGGLDLYITRFADSVWTEPVNLGPEINSAYDETTPFLARDGKTLYFSSNRLNSLGGLDVFRSVFESTDGKWTVPLNLGAPVNSPADDAYFRLTSDGRSAFFSSSRLENQGQRDLYVAYFKGEQLEQIAAGTKAAFLQPLKSAETTASVGGNQELPALSPLFYTNDRDISASDNFKHFDAIAALMRNYPEATMFVTAHTDATGPLKFDLYYGIKRAELAGNALANRGISTDRIVLRSAGPGYPVGKASLEGNSFNRRIEFSLTLPDGSVPVVPAIPKVPKEQELPSPISFYEKNQGLTYRVDIINTRQLYANDALYAFPELLIVSTPGSGNYRYTAGLFDQYKAAAKFRDDLIRQGFAEAQVAAFIDGVRLPKPEAVSKVKRFPDLLNFVRG